MIKTIQMQVIEDRLGKPIQALIRDRIEAGLSLDETAEELGITRATLYAWMDRLGGTVKRTVAFRDDEAAALA